MIINKILSATPLAGVVAVVAVVALGGCTETRKSLGLTRSDLTGFDVYDHPELVVPPHVTALPIPSPRVEDDLGASAHRRQAAEAVIGGGGALGTEGSGASIHSPAVAGLLNRAGASTGVDTPGDHAIRAQVDQEAGPKKTDKTVVQKMLFWQKNKGEQADVIDPVAEYEAHHPGTLSTLKTDGEK